MLKLLFSRFSVAFLGKIIEFIADISDSFYKNAAADLDFTPKSSDVDINSSLTAVVVVSPYIGQKRFPAEHSAAVRCQIFQQFIFGKRKVKQFAGKGYLAFVGIDAKIIAGNDVFVNVVRQFDDTLYAENHLASVPWFQYEILDERM
jgi:hypothetical protein